MKKTSLFAAALCSVLLATPCAMAEDTVEMIKSAGTTQAFTQEAVAEEDVQKILEAGLAAASAINQQPWHFVALTNQEIMTELASLSMGGMPQGAPEGAEKPADMPQNAPEGADMPDGAPQQGAAPAGMSAKASLGDSPLAIIIYMDENTKSPNPDFDCGLACQNMVIAATALGYDTKIVSAPAMTLNGEQHDAICEKLGVDTSLQAAAVLLVGHADDTADVTSSASARETVETKVSFVK